ncbi:MAG: flavin reductase family protein [Pseudonocardia sp.]|uniref:flavin reductase family protein n=1 Tax=unclassified Pseudonocardia TaxID=2619320 RepID=UPI001AC563E0|nr:MULTISPECIES: flavin reductase family protein [unclassified Pseudonocardia]MBN9112417.1 flavin reductase family protein [Pseudonocardia sp.]
MEEPDVHSAVDLRELFGCFPSGVTAVCALSEGRPVGLAASSFTSVSIDPPLVAVCAQAGSMTWPILRKAPKLGLTVLGEEHGDVCRALAAKDPLARFLHATWNGDATGAVFIDGGVASIRSSVYDEFPAGDHQIVVLRVEAFSSAPHAQPLVFHGSRFRGLTPVTREDETA